MWIREGWRTDETVFSVRYPDRTEFTEVGRARVPTNGLGIFSVSPDGGRIAFFRERADGAGLDLVSMSRGTGESEVLATLEGAAGGWVTDWSTGGFVYADAFISDNQSWLHFRVRGDTGGTPEEIALPDLGATVSGWMKALPGDRAVLFHASGRDGEGARVSAFDLTSGEMVEITSDGGVGEWSPTGHVLYARSGGFVDAVPFDPVALKVLGDPVQVLTGLRADEDIANFDVSASGTLVYVEGPATGGGSADQLFVWEWIRPDGSVDSIPLAPTDNRGAALSPDGTRLVYVRTGRIWIHDLLRGSNRPLTEDDPGEGEVRPLWSPDGQRIVYSAIREGSGERDLYVRNADGTGAIERVGGTPLNDYATDWLDDGTIVFQAMVPSNFGLGTQFDIYVTSVDDPDAQTALLEADYGETAAEVSPDGEWMAYFSSQNGPWSLWIRRYPTMESPLQVSRPEEGEARNYAGTRWVGGRSLEYRGGDTIITAELDLAGDVPRVVSRRPGPPVGPNAFIVGRHPVDGRLLTARLQGSDPLFGDTDDLKLVMVTNWLSELRRMMEGNR